MTNTYAARSHSAWFGRTLDALQRRQPAIAELLPALTAQTLDAQVIDRCWATVESLSRPKGSPDTPEGRAAIDPGPALRRMRQLLVMAIIERDVTQQAPLSEVCGAISAWGIRAVEVAMRHAAAELAGVHGRPLDSEGAPQDLLVIGMGKIGGNELNVSSDIDLVFAHRDGGQTENGRLSSGEFFHRAARKLCGTLSDVTEDGFVFRVDTRLRPNGDAGPLVVNLPMLENYFYEQGREWERFAWVKALVIADSGLAGDAARRADEAQLGAIVEPFVYRRYLDFAAIDAMRDLHELIRTESSRRSVRRDTRDGGGIDVKIGRGGIREIEFCAQLFQVVRGGRDALLRDRRTLVTLQTLAQRRLLDPQAVDGLAQAYQLLRRIEHALQYQDDAQTHRLPDDRQIQARIAAMLDMPVDAFTFELANAREHVVTVFDSLLGTPQVATGDETAPPRVLDQASQARINALHEGRRYRLARPDTQRRIDQLLEMALREATRIGAPDDAWLGRLADLLETIAGRPAYLALLVQFPGAFRQLLRMIGQTRWAADYLMRHPIVLDELLDGQVLEPPDYPGWQRVTEAALAALAPVGGQPDIERQMDVLREAHHAQVFRLLAQDLAGRLSVERLSDHLSELADRVLTLSMACAWQQVRHRHRDTPRFAVIAYGKLGGKELGYASDLDLVFLYDDDHENAQPVYAQLAQRLSAWLSTRTAAGQLFEIDLRLRPNGNAGLLVSNLNAFRIYQLESAWTWEHQALTRARFAAGDPAIGERFESLRREILALPRELKTLCEAVGSMRHKMLDAHPNPSGLFDIKHDRGGMVDIEFLVQTLVLGHASQHPELLDNVGNIALLERAAKAGLIDARNAELCAQAYRDFRRMQHLLRLNDARFARVEADTISDQRDAVLRLWRAVLGD